jgi:hypothetical protein
MHDLTLKSSHDFETPEWKKKKGNKKTYSISKVGSQLLDKKGEAPGDPL